MNFSLFDVVILANDMPNEGLHAGMKGAVIDIYTEPTTAYEVEFCDDEGRTIALLALSAEQLLSAS
jgi:hypothetical protein